eukprot:gene2635-3734_t
MSTLSVLLLGWVRWQVPNFPGQEAGRQQSVRRVFLLPGVRPVLAVMLAFVLAHNILYTYIAPFLAHAGLGGRVDLVLLVFGAASLVGIWVTGVLIDRWLRELVLANMSTRAAEALREDLESRGPMRLSEVETQQKEILKIVRRLADEGQIMLGGG